MILVETPQGRRQSEKKYAAESLLGDLLGIKCNVAIGTSDDWIIRHDEKSLKIPNYLFSTSQEKDYLKESSLPQFPLRVATAEELSVPANLLVADNLPLFWSSTKRVLATNLDFFGTIFVLLTRYEESILSVRDEDGRFPAAASLAGRGGFLERPLADEYAAVFYYTLQQSLGPVSRIESHYNFRLSHDVDLPLSWLRNPALSLMKRLGGDILKRRSFRCAASSIQGYLNPNFDPLNTFSWIMDVSEKNLLKSNFYFLAGGSHRKDIQYDLRLPFFKILMTTILKRGHQIGIHGSYDSSEKVGLLAKEVKTLETVAGCSIRGGRQHFLRFSNPETWRLWNDAGLDYDSTLGFAEAPGFRCGTSKMYTTFDLFTSQKLRLKEVPLLVMEHTLLHPSYLGLNRERAFEKCSLLVDRTRKYGGTFTMLWHNHNLVINEDRELYSNVIHYGVNL